MNTKLVSEIKRVKWVMWQLLHCLLIIDSTFFSSFFMQVVDQSGNEIDWSSRDMSNDGMIKHLEAAWAEAKDLVRSKIMN